MPSFIGGREDTIKNSVAHFNHDFKRMMDDYYGPEGSYTTAIDKINEKVKVDTKTRKESMKRDGANAPIVEPTAT